MKPIDRWLQKYRIERAGRYLRKGARVLDVGCADGALFRQLGERIAGGVGIDPLLEESEDHGDFELIPGSLQDAELGNQEFDAITLLAVVEHLPETTLAALAQECFLRLRSNGVVVITVPAPVVDRILSALLSVRLIDGMSLEEHHEFDPRRVPSIFAPPRFRLMRSSRFELGLNHLFVFKKDVEVHGRSPGRVG